MIKQFFPMFFSLFIIMDPVGLIPLYIGLTSRHTEAERRRIIRDTALVTLFLTALFIAAGKYILAALQIETGSFYIAGGIMLFIIALEMLFGRASGTKVSGHEEEEARRNVAVFPLAIPMLAGPGTITTILLFTGAPGAGVSVMLMLFVAVGLTLGIVCLLLRASDLILKTLGRSGVTVLERIMGMLLSGMAVQYVYDGLIRLRVLAGG